MTNMIKGEREREGDRQRDRQRQRELVSRLETEMGVVF